MMDSFEKTLQGQMTELAQSADPAGAQRVLRHLPGEAAPTVTTRRRGRTPRMLLMGTAGAVTAAAAVLALNAAGVIGTAPTQAAASSKTSASASASANHGPRTGSAEVPHLWGPGEPCPFARPATVTQLAATAKVPIWIPDNDPSKVTDSWSCAGVPFAMIGDVQISYEPGWGKVNVHAQWSDLAKVWGGHIAMIAGHEALVQPANAPADAIFNAGGIPVSTKGTTRNQIMIVDHGTLIRFLSKSDVPMSQLLADANALDFSQPVTAH